MSKSENETRIQLIDKQLAQAGWDVKDRTQVVQEFEILLGKGTTKVSEPQPAYGEFQFSDYVLLGKNAKPLAVVEAKRTSKDPAMGREQAKQYCLNIQKALG